MHTRTHTQIFQETIREAGLNIYLFELADIREQCYGATWAEGRGDSEGYTTGENDDSQGEVTPAYQVGDVA